MLTKNSFYEVMKLVYCGLIVVEQKYYKMFRFTLIQLQHSFVFICSRFQCQVVCEKKIEM
jgi:hypothetical protein